MYMNVFRHRKATGFDAEAYARDADRMEALAREQKGFIAFRRYTSPDGEFLSMSEWETREDAQAWARHPEHVDIQGRGRAQYYQTYVVYSCLDPEVRRFESPRPS